MSNIIGRGRYATETYPSRATASSSFGSGLVWRPDGLGNVQTWAEVMAVVSTSKTPITVYVPQPAITYSIPAGNYDTKALDFEAPLNPSSIVTVQIEDGALLRNLGGIGGAMVLRGASNATCLAYDGDFGFLRLHEFARISNSTVTPMLQLTAGNTFAIYFEELAAADGPIVNATGGILGILVSEQALEITNDFATGAGPATVGFIHDGTLNFPALAGFGSTVNLPMGQDGGSGPSAFRPVGLFQPVKSGCTYFDTDISKMIFWDGALWTTIGPSTGLPGFENIVALNLGAGSTALVALTTGTDNTAAGVLAGAAVTSGTQNNAFGAQALKACTAGSDNVAVGAGALVLCTIGTANIAIGTTAMAALVDGNTNVAIGYAALQDCVSGSNNVALGLDALNACTVSEMTGVGTGALASNVTGVHCVAVGYNALNSSTDSDNTAVGYKASEATTTAINNTAVGSLSMNATTDGSFNTAVGYRALFTNVSGIFNVAIGDDALKLCTASQNTAVGHASMSAVTSGSQNVALGDGAGASITTGSGNTCLGMGAGANLGTGFVNLLVGDNAGGTLTTGSSNVLIADDVPTAGTSSYLGIGNGTITGDLAAKQITFRLLTTAGITASNPPLQGSGALTSNVNQVSTVANVNDNVTLPPALAGLEVIVINSDPANALQVFPALGDDLGAGVDVSTTQAAGVTNRYVAYDTINWVKLP